MESSQNQVKRTISSPEVLAFIGSLLEEDESLTRTDVARSVCEQFGFRDPRGEIQLSTCLRALRELDTEGLLELPEASFEKGGPSPLRLTQPVANPKDVPGMVGAIKGLELVLVTDEVLRRTWNELVETSTY